MKTRPLLFAAVLALAPACGQATDDTDLEAPDAGEGMDADAGAGVFSFHLDDSCRTGGFDVDGAKTTLQTASGLVVKDQPDPETPWCQDLTPRTVDVSDSSGGYEAAAHLELKRGQNTVTVVASSQASGPENDWGYFAQGAAGFTQLDIRGGGGGVTRVRTTVDCSGTVEATGNGIAGISVERCNGESICGLAPAIPGIAEGWSPGDSASFEETTSSPDSVVACLRIGFDSMAAGGSAAASGTITITVEPLP